jgi:hypothetical protein
MPKNSYIALINEERSPLRNRIIEFEISRIKIKPVMISFCRAFVYRGKYNSVKIMPKRLNFTRIN